MSEEELQSGAFLVCAHVFFGQSKVYDAVFLFFLFTAFADHIVQWPLEFEFQLRNHVQSRVLWVGYISCESDKFVFSVRHNVNGLKIRQYTPSDRLGRG